MTTENKLSLYSMTTAMLELLEAEEEVTQEQMDEAFGAITAKENRVAFFIRDIESSIKAHKEEEQRIAARRKVMENKVAQLKRLIQESLERLQMPKINTGTFTLSLVKNPPALEITDEEAIPNEWKIVIPQQLQADKARIKAALTAGTTIPGAELKQGVSLRTK